MVNIPLRYTIPLDDIEHIVGKIEVYNRTISVYERWKERNGEYQYVDEKILELTNTLCEYMIARCYCQEGARTYGKGDDIYAKVKAEFEEEFPFREFPLLEESIK